MLWLSPSLPGNRLAHHQWMFSNTCGESVILDWQIMCSLSFTFILPFSSGLLFFFFVVLAVTLMSNVFSLSEDTTFTASVIAAQVPVIHSLTLSFFFLKTFSLLRTRFEKHVPFLGYPPKTLLFLEPLFLSQNNCATFSGILSYISVRMCS